MANIRKIRMPDGTLVPHPEDLFASKKDVATSSTPPVQETNDVATSRSSTPDPSHAMPLTPEQEAFARQYGGAMPTPDASPMAAAAHEIGKLRDGTSQFSEGNWTTEKDAFADSIGGGGGGGGGGGDMQTVLRELVNATNLNTTLLQQIADSLDDGVKMTF